MTVKFITGEANLDGDWDTYVKNLDAMGIDSFIEIFRTAFARAHE